MRRYDAELVVDARAIVGESPVWDEQRGVLWWVDILGRLLHAFDPSTGENDSTELADIVGAVVLRPDGGLAAAIENGFADLDPTTGRCDPISLLDGNTGPKTRMNDGKCDPNGRFLAGTMAYDVTPGAGALYRLEPNGTVRTLLDEVTLSNGLDWSPDGALFYFIDSMAGGIDVFDVDPAGALSNRRRLVDTPVDDGIPDGLTVDSEGYIWVALYLGGCVNRYAPDGTLDAVVTMPIRTPTCPVFGGPNLTDLYITSSAMVMADPSDEPGAGGLFRCSVGVHGRPATRLAVP
jgi:sugar lactone lactonase YvrE